MDRQRRANNPENYDKKGRLKKRGKQHFTGNTASGIWPPDVAKPAASANSLPIARACMAASFMRS
jgi:hypothetical protein